MKDRQTSDFNISVDKQNRLPAFLLRRKSWICLVVNLIMYIGFVLADGPVWCRDSASYVNMETMREPLYCSFLWLMRFLFGDPSAGWNSGQHHIHSEGLIRGASGILVHGWDLTDRVAGKVPALLPAYMMAAVVLQSAVSAFTAWYLAKFCWRIGRSVSVRNAFFSASTANLVIWGVAALNRFGAKRGSSYEQSIMTEGLGISFYILFIVFLCQYLEDHVRKSRYLGLSCLMMLLCILTHKQLAITAIIFGISTLTADLVISRRRKKNGLSGSFIRLFGKDLLILILTLLSAYLLEHAYHLAVQGRWSNHTGSADKIDTTLLYTSDREDASLFDDRDLRDLFLDLEDEMEEQKLRYLDVPEDADWVELCSHYADSYDIIGFEVLDPMVESFVRLHYPGLKPGSTEEIILEDQVCKDLEHGLIQQNPSRLIHLWWGNFRKGFVNTILRVSPVLNWLSLALWGAYTAMIAILLVRGRRSSNVTVRFALLVLTGTIVNSAVVGVIIFPQTRYMIYNMGLFYITAFLLLEELVYFTPKQRK